MRKKIALVFMVVLLVQACGISTGFAEDENFLRDVYTFSGTIEVNGESVKQDEHLLDFDIPAGKIVALCYLNTNSQLPASYIKTYLGFKEVGSGKDCEVWTGGYSEPSRMRFFRTTQAQQGRFKIAAGVEKRAGATDSPSFTFSYTVSVKILDEATFVPRDPAGEVTGDKNFFLSSGPEAIRPENLYTPEYRQYLCRAPINGNANIYWTHLEMTGKSAYFGVLLSNWEEYPITLQVRSSNYRNAKTLDESYTKLHTELFEDYAKGKGAKNEPIVLQPGESRWLEVYQMSSALTGETAGLANLVTDYLGRNLICTTYAFASKDNIDFIPKNYANWEVETLPDLTSMRGSGNGAVLELSGAKKEIPFSTLVSGEHIINPGENIYLSRLIGNQYVSADNKSGYSRIDFGETDTVPNLGFDDMQLLNSYNCNFGTIYKMDLNQFQASKSLSDGKRVVGKIKFATRSCAVLSQMDMAYVNVTVWRTKNGVLDSSQTQTVDLKRCLGIDPSAGTALYPYRGYQEDMQERWKEGVYWAFDTNVPFYDTENEYAYYIVGSAMSSLPFEICFEYEDIALSEGANTVYYNEAPVAFPDVQPQIISDRMMVPVRGIFEAAGASISFGDGTATIFRGDRVVTITQGSDSITVLNTRDHTRSESKLDVPAQIVDGRMMIPLRAIGENLGLRVSWAAGLASVFING